jgi:hypothetical protein
MLKEKIYNSSIILFFGLLIIYTLHTPPKVVVKHLNINELAKIQYLDDLVDYSNDSNNTC